MSADVLLDTLFSTNFSKYSVETVVSKATIKAIRRNQTDKAIEIIGSYELPLYLKERIADENAQLSM